MEFYGGIEAGGTKFVCAIGNDPDHIFAEVRFETSSPDETLKKSVKFFKNHSQEFPLKAIGIASFGPVDINPGSPTYGSITKTPKPGWSDTNIVGVIKDAFEVPVVFDTDVNGALLGEHHWGAVQGIDNSIYLTIGTGIGGGAMVDGNLVHGLVHPEMGHVRLPHDRKLDPFDGICPFHNDCFEGLAAGPAVERRWEQSAQSLHPEHPAWGLEAHYIALALHNLICVFSPQRIVLGGGIMKQNQLYPMIRQKVHDSLNGYVKNKKILEEIDDYIVPPGLGDQAGVLGAIALARKAN